MSRILVIDDEADMRVTLEHVLCAAGHEVVCAENGKVGLRLHKADPVTLVITDIFMPEKEGLETIREFQRDYPDVTLIAMSGRPDTANAFYLAQRLGAYRVLEKPFQPHELLNLVADALRRQP
jgi:DNA-binding NtrC family response regulator